jgi:hypothetical protein
MVLRCEGIRNTFLCYVIYLLQFDMMCASGFEWLLVITTLGDLFHLFF